MIEPTTTDLGRRVLHTGFFGHARAGVLKGYDSKGYAKVLFDGRHEYSYVTLKNVAWDDDRLTPAMRAGIEMHAAMLKAPPDPPPRADEDDDGDGLVAVGAILGGVVEDIASAMGSDDDGDSEIEGGGGSFGGGGADGSY